MSRDPTRLALSITHADGRVTRLGPDEVDAADIPQGLVLEDSIPGGYKTCSLGLLRRIDREYPDLRLRDDVHVYGLGNRTAWEGRMATLPRSHGDGFSINPGAVGHARLLAERPDFVEVYVDRDPGSWSDIPLARKVVLLAAAHSLADFSLTAEGGALVCPFPNQALGGSPVAELQYRFPAGGKAAIVKYVSSVNSLPASYLTRVWASDTEDLSGSIESYTFTNDSTLRTHTLTTQRRYLTVQIDANSSAVTPAAGSNWRASKIAVYGNHGLTTRAISGEPDGVYVTDVVADIVTRTAPGLNFTTGPDGSIEPGTTIAPHLVYATSGKGEDAILAANAFMQREWGVYDNREFFFREPDPARLTWEARQSDGAQLTFEGETAEEVFNGVFVIYTDAASGQRKTVGPPGATADDTDASLEDTDPTNPVNEQGEIYWAKLELDRVNTLAGATAIGAAFLTEKSRANRVGQLTVQGMNIRHPTEGACPVWRPRSGDFVVVADHSRSVYRRIIEKRYDAATRTCVMSLDNTSQIVTAILERYGAALTGVV